ncbi:MAG: hypothetical protein JNG88_16015 [Phycisphaerales bacterium]|nr:hypothetical protein [Phycisphaerales bacterium]
MNSFLAAAQQLLEPTLHRHSPRYNMPQIVLQKHELLDSPLIKSIVAPKDRVFDSARRVDSSPDGLFQRAVEHLRPISAGLLLEREFQPLSRDTFTNRKKIREKADGLH